MKKYLYLLIFVFCAMIQSSFAQNSDSISNNPVEWDASYIFDAGRNFTGGLKLGNAYMGLAKAGVLLRSNKFWKGGEFYAELMNTHGVNLSGDYIGDMQIASNIENGNYTFIEKLYFKQNFSKLSLVIGLQDLNEEFCTSEYGGALTNSSFGIHSTFPLNFGVPIYPKTALSIAALFNINENITLRTSVFDGDAGSLEDDPHNFDWSVSSEEGLLTVDEIEYKSSSEKLTSIKIGGFYHTADFNDADDSLKSIKENYGFYGICDKQVYENGSQKIGLFGQLAFFPSKANINTTYLGAGLNFVGLFEKRPDDCLATGVAYSRLFDKTYECDMEFNYSFAFGSHITVQPAFHYIIHPGANQGLNNAFAGFLRVSISK
jgi:porin